eukprot:COSAG06_NODE_11740_length_1471_cov_0.637755_2_plen_147_part_01
MPRSSSCIWVYIWHACPWSRYIAESEHLGTRVDPRITTPLEEASLRTFERFLRNVTRWAAVASAAHPGQHNITVGAIGFDQEQLCGEGNAFCLSQLLYKTINLPRQAQDGHRKSAETTGVFCRVLLVARPKRHVQCFDVRCHHCQEQ